MIRMMLLTVGATMPNVTVPEAPSVDTDGIGEFFGLFGSVFGIINQIKWCGVPVYVWLVGAAAFALVAAFFKGKD